MRDFKRALLAYLQGVTEYELTGARQLAPGIILVSDNYDEAVGVGEMTAYFDTQIWTGNAMGVFPDDRTAESPELAKNEIGQIVSIGFRPLPTNFEEFAERLKPHMRRKGQETEQLPDWQLQPALLSS